MTQKQLIDQFCEFRGKCTTDDVVALNFAYEMLAPRWISVDDELPKEHEWILGFSLKRSYIDVYNFDSNGLIEAHGITHWMHLSPPPILSNSEKTGKNHLIDANNMVDHFADISKMVEKGGKQ